VVRPSCIQNERARALGLGRIANPPALQPQRSRQQNGLALRTDCRQQRPLLPLPNPLLPFVKDDQGGAPGRHRPCRTRPADRSLVAEDRSAGGVRDRTGPDTRSVLGPWRAGAAGARMVTSRHQGRSGTAGRPAFKSGSSHDASARIRLWSRRSGLPSTYVVAWTLCRSSALIRT
jgi:hypothetical protein